MSAPADIPPAVIRPAVSALLVATAGGAVAAWFGLPLAWMIGAMLATGCVAMAGMRVAIPPRLRSVMVSVLGIMLGSTFTPEILERAGDWGVSLAGLAVYIVVATTIGVLFLRRFLGLDLVTAYFTATPGGLTEMVLTGGALGGDDRTISLVHGTRIMLVVMTVPFWFTLLDGYDAGSRGVAAAAATGLTVRDAALLAVAAVVGAPVASRLRLPAAALIGPMVLSAAIHLAGLTESRPPDVLIAASQVVVGAAIGCRYAGLRLARVAQAVVIAVGLTALMLAIGVAMAFVIRHLTGLALGGLILAYAPGGLAEMSLIALSLDLDAAFVSTHHMVRILLIVVLAPAAFHLIRRRRSPASEPDRQAGD